MTSVMTTRRSRGLRSGKSGCPQPPVRASFRPQPRPLRAQRPTVTVAMETSCTQVEPTVTPITFSWFCRLPWGAQSLLSTPEPVTQPGPWGQELEVENVPCPTSGPCVGLPQHGAWVWTEP